MGRQNPITVTQLKLHFIQHIPHRLYFLCVMHNQTPFKISLFHVWMTLREPPSAEMEPASNIYPLISKAVLAECLLHKYKPEGAFFSIISQLQHSTTAPHPLPHPSIPSPHPYQPPPPPPIFSVAQQPSVINELLQFDLIYLRIGHVW